MGGVVSEYYPARRRVRRFRAVVGLVLIGLLVAGGVSGYMLVFEPGRTEARQAGNVEQAELRVRSFADAWTGRQLTTASQFTDNPAEAASLLTSIDRNIKPSGFTITVGKGKPEQAGDSDGPVIVPFSVKMNVPRVGRFEYSSKARVFRSPTGVLLITFKSSVLHPLLQDGQTLAVAKRPSRGKILDRNGAELDVADSLVGQVNEKDEGISGLQERYDDVLSGTAEDYAVAITDRDTGKAVRTIAKPGSRTGQDVRTTIDPAVQRAAAAALAKASTPAALVAIKPSNGDILAVANEPSGYNRALVGQYPPGSTFKVVTAAALLEAGMSPDDGMECPQYEWVSGFRFENQDEFSLGGGSTFRDAFARSCNTAFVAARSQLDDDTLADTASAFGIGGQWDSGISTYDGSVPVNTDVTDKAAAMIGQGRDLASPLVMASVAATVKSGKFAQPRLVPDHVKNPYQAPRELDAAVLENLRSMMRSVVTDGAGDALKNVPGEPHAKTGTAEFGDEDPPETHAWMIGYQGDADIAWAVLLEGGGSGGKDAGPIAAAFLNALK